MNTGQRIVRNSIFGIVSQAIGGGIFFLVALLMARHLRPDQFGVFTFIFAFVSVFYLLADFGLTNILVREISRQKDRLGYILGAVIPLITVVALILYLLIVAITQFLQLDKEATMAMYVMAATVLITFHAAVYGSVCRAFEEMGFNALGLTLQRILLLALVMVALDSDAGLPGFAFCYLGERVFQWVFFYVLVRRRYTNYRWRVDTDYWRYLLIEGFPVGVGTVLCRISWHVNIFLLTLLSTVSSVGLFGAAYRIIQMIQVIPFTLSVPVFPVLSRRAAESSRQAFTLYLRILKMFMLVGMPIGVWFMFLGTPLVELLFGSDYRPAGPTLQIMGGVIALLFLNSLYVFLFSSLNKQGLFMAGTSIAVGVNIIVGLLLIPILDMQGAAIAAVCAETALFVSGAIFLSKVGLTTRYHNLLLKPIITVMLASVVLLWPLLKPSFVNIVAGSLVFGLLFPGLAYLFRIINHEDIEALVAALPKLGKAGNRDTSNQSTLKNGS